jgi:hypothetical protein
MVLVGEWAGIGSRKVSRLRRSFCRRDAGWTNRFSSSPLDESSFYLGIGGDRVRG